MKIFPGDSVKVETEKGIKFSGIVFAVRKGYIIVHLMMTWMIAKPGIDKIEVIGDEV